MLAKRDLAPGLGLRPCRCTSFWPSPPLGCSCFTWPYVLTRHGRDSLRAMVDGTMSDTVAEEHHREVVVSGILVMSTGRAGRPLRNRWLWLL